MLNTLPIVIKIIYLVALNFVFAIAISRAKTIASLP
jgi:hypothetical protein